MSIEAVWRSNKPEVIEPWEAYLRARRQFHADVKQALIEVGMEGQGAAVTDGLSGLRLVGIRAQERQTPEHWRYAKRLGCLVPNRSKAEGKRIAKRLESVRLGDWQSSIKGMPDVHFGAGHLLSPGCEQHGGYLYVMWGTPDVAGEVDESLWERVKLSEFYAAREAEEEASS